MRRNNLTVKRAIPNCDSKPGFYSPMLFLTHSDRKNEKKMEKSVKAEKSSFLLVSQK